MTAMMAWKTAPCLLRAVSMHTNYGRTMSQDVPRPRYPETSSKIRNVSNLCVKHSILAWLRLNKWKSQMISLRAPTNTRRRNVKCTISCDLYWWATNKSPCGRRNLGIACRKKKNMWKVEETAKDNVHVAVSFKIKKASELAVAHGMPNIG